MDLDDRPILVAPDSFKGTMSAATVASEVGRGLRGVGVRADLAPAADGGEGTMDVLLEAIGGELVPAAAHDALGREIDARFALLADNRTAVVEVAAASGLALIPTDERDAEAASSAGTGELIAAAVARGARQILVAAGGSATTDGGQGAVAAAGDVHGASITVLCDVRTPFEQAAIVFGPQKGADAAAVRRLTRRLESFRLPRGVPMTGAAGGLSGGLWAHLGAKLVAGAPFVLDAIDFDRRMLASAAVVVGEGELDATSLQGKIVAEIATRARQNGVPAYAIVGRSSIAHFESRILDIQMIWEASDYRDLASAGASLGTLVRKTFTGQHGR